MYAAARPVAEDLRGADSKPGLTMAKSSLCRNIYYSWHSKSNGKTQKQ